MEALQGLSAAVGGVIVVSAYALFLLRAVLKEKYKPPPPPVIACPDCGGKVSTKAATCPHCGRPKD